ncbi:MAG: hypothetical protein ACPGVO_19850 [Spirulinaceae cyanobacterium]
MIWLLLLLCVIYILWQYQRGGLGRFTLPFSGKRSGQFFLGGQSASETKLIRRVGPGAANRLISNLQRKNPGKSRAWCADKALYDLERGR